MAGLALYEIVAVGAIVLVVVAYVTFRLLHTYRLKRLKAMRGEGAGPQFASDRAYNRLALARREAQLLEAQGGDVTRAQELIALANRSLDSREFDRAYELAQAAHETLVRARREPRRPTEPAAPPAPLTTAPSSGAPPAAPPAPPLPKNRAEAQFQLRLFEGDLLKAKQSAPDAPATAGASQLYVQAHAAFDRGEFLEAFRLSLRGRRWVGGQVESLAPSNGTPAPPTARASLPEADLTRAAEQAAGADRCPNCGQPVVAGDAFCRGCGTPRGPAVCPKCGAPRRSTDTFCGRCGERYS